MTVKNVFKTALNQLANPEKAVQLTRFFKTGEGQYGAGDQFLGITVPQIRLLAKEYLTISADHLSDLLQSSWHEHRTAALIVLIHQYRKTKNPKEQKQIYQFYKNHMPCINNWDLVDISAAPIVGHFYSDKDKDFLYSLVQSKKMWYRRIGIVSTHYFIRQTDFTEALALSALLLKDTEDLMHKAVGWTLREIYKKEPSLVLAFIEKNYEKMPRTALRYAIEKVPEKQRKLILTEGRF